jgi:uncharacterized protein YjfI (DUF2170 family)
MKQDSQPSGATAAVRRFRDRLRDRGLVKKDVWIRPEYADRLSALEREMREPAGSLAAPETPAAWSVAGLQAALVACPLVAAGLLTVSRIEGAEPTLRLGVKIPGEAEVDVLLAVAGEQIMVETFLWPAASVVDVASFNECVLRTHKYLPLATFSITDIAGQPSYTLFGDLDARSSLSSVMFELQSLAEASLSARALYCDYLSEQVSP